MALAELLSALYVGYRSLPEHEQTRIRMLILQRAASTTRGLAEAIGRVAIDLEKAYYKETMTNG